MRIVVVEDEIRIREGLCNLIGKISAEYEILGQASNGKEGMELILLANPEAGRKELLWPGHRRARPSRRVRGTRSDLFRLLHLFLSGLPERGTEPIRQQ